MSLRLSEEQLATVERLKRRFHQRSVGATLKFLLEEKLRQERFPAIGFRDTAAGREAHVVGTGLGVWEVMMIARAYGYDRAKTAEHLDIPEPLVQASFDYRDAFPQEVDAELAELDAMDFEALKRLLPNIRQFVVQDEVGQEG